jgi:hypothetical protein
MVPTTLEAGEATLYLLNERDASVPYNFNCVPGAECKLLKVAEGSIKPLSKFSVVGEGYYPVEIPDPANAIKDLQANVGYDKMGPAEQYTTLQKRMSKDWGRVPTADFLTLEQNGQKREIFVESCGLLPEGMTLNFIAPPDIKPGPATLTMTVRKDNAVAATSAPLNVTIQ